MENDLDKKIKGEINEIFKHYEGKGLSDDAITKIIFEKLANRYSPAEIEKNLLKNLDNDENFNLYDSVQLPNILNFLKQNPKIIYIIIICLSVVALLSFGILLLTK
jgi:hypothetical protein